MGNKIVTFIKANDYDRLKKDEEIELVVKAKNRKPMKIYASRISLAEDNEPDYSGYEGAVFNGECN